MPHDRGYEVRYLDAAVEPIDHGAVTNAELLVMPGGPVGANDSDRYPFLRDELTAVGARLAGGLPTVGICLGAQLLARGLGAAVITGPVTEIGYAPLTITSEGMSSALRHLAGVPVLHWHNDWFELPTGARHLASTARCPNQAFAVGNRSLGLQFHLETDYRDIERWLVGHAEALPRAGADPRTVRGDAVAADRS